MRISLNWLKDYIEIPCDSKELGEILTSLGLEVEGTEETESITGGLKGVVIGEVKTCIKHPNADKLSLTTVDIGESNMLQIVCGAPNVAAGQKVLVATVGSTIYPTAGEPITLKKGKIRGEASEGMICAEDELGLGTSHEGILVLPTDAQVGQPAATYFNIQTDVVYEIGLTPNRSDATSHLGVARDLAAYFSYQYNKDWKLREPKGDKLTIDADKLPITVNIIDTEGTPRFSGAVLDHISLTASPEWMQHRLKAVGVRPINVVVDITNYVLHEFGQPQHAYDYDKIADQTIYVEQLSEGTIFLSLDEKERKLRHEDIMVCDGNHQGMCMGGVFGGANSGVTAATKRIFLEAAHFNAIRIRKTSMSHILRTDAAKCFEKGTDPNITVAALQRSIALLKQYAGARLASDIIDIYPNPIERVKVKVRLANVNRLIGQTFDKAEIERLSKALDFNIQWLDDEQFTVDIPTNKTDVLREADVIEEFLRIYGFDNVIVEDRFESALITAEAMPPDRLRESLAGFLVGKGMNQMMGLSLIPSAVYKDTAYKDQLVLINNTSNIHLDAMRPEMMASGLQSVAYNLNRQQANLNLFEFGHSYRQQENKITEEEYVSIFIAGSSEGDSWLANAYPTGFYEIKRLVLEILNKCHVKGFSAQEIEDDRFSYGLSYLRGQKLIANVGKVSQRWAKQMEIKSEVFFAEIPMKTLLASAQKASVEVEDIPKFPSSRRDIAIIMDELISFGQLSALIEKNGTKILSGIELFDVYKNKEQLGVGKKSYAISLTFVDAEKNLNDKYLDKLVSKIVESLINEFGVILRK